MIKLTKEQDQVSSHSDSERPNPISVQFLLFGLTYSATVLFKYPSVWMNHLPSQALHAVRYCHLGDLSSNLREWDRAACLHHLPPRTHQQIRDILSSWFTPGISPTFYDRWALCKKNSSSIKEEEREEPMMEMPSLGWLRPLINKD